MSNASATVRPAVLGDSVSNPMLRRLLLILAVIVFAAGCATRRPAPVVSAPPLVDVLPLLSRGCYRCFEEAFAVATRQGQPGLALEAALLASLRSKELGMPPDEWMARARVAAGGDPAVADLIEMAGAVSSDAHSGDREATSA